MNDNIKAISLLAFALILTLASCKKEQATSIIKTTSSVDLRDSVIGTYNCIKHYSYNTMWYDSFYHWGRGDTILGPMVITVSKSANNDTSLSIAGYDYNFVSDNGFRYNYFKWTYQGANDNANFIKSNDSIWFQDTYSQGISHWDYYYYTGHKQ